MTWKRIRQQHEDGTVSDVTVHADTLAALSGEQLALVEELDESPLDSAGRPRDPSYPAAAAGSGDESAYGDLTKDELTAEVARRNEHRDVDQQIVVVSSATKADLAAELAADDGDS